MLTHPSAAVAVLFLALTACQPAAPAGLSDADRAAMKALDADFTNKAMASDYTALVNSYYTDDAVLMAPNAPAATGHAAIEAVLRSFPPISSFTTQSDDMVGVGDLAYSRGNYAMTMTPPGGAVINDTGKFLAIFRKQQDGSWKVSRDIFNSDLPLQAPAPAAPMKKQ